MIETVVQKEIPWLDASGPEAANVIYCSATLSRNLADLPFPARCSEEELRNAQDRILTAFESEGLMARGQYYSLAELTAAEVRFLQERDLIRGGFFALENACGIYVSGDHFTSILVNEADHIVIRCHASGLAVDQAMRRAYLIDDALSNSLDFAFDEKLGYLTSSIETVGTGLVLRAAIHVPGLAMTNKLHESGTLAQEEFHTLRAGTGSASASLDQATAAGDIAELSNEATLGRSEEEIMFHFNHRASAILEAERTARDQLLHDGRAGIEDRAGRALGIAKGAALMEDDEARSLLSSLRLGVQAGLIDNVPMQTLNTVLVSSRRGHLELQTNQSADGLALSTLRAERFRTSFS